ncbi:acyl-CoA dehydrogenase family protein [Peribacillus sp. FSL E2-0218]|uniref:acyl-CoA dehydrogenase family protein n=1 Tax=Peribacillus sp. FSL E2-0218 TaxID=2921364 RepID=UPI0030EC892E
MVNTMAVNKDESRSFFTKEHLLFRRSFREFLDNEAVPHYHQWEKEGEIPRSFRKKMGDNGFLSPWLDVEFGGSGADFAYSVVVAEELERIRSGLAGIFIDSDVVARYIASFGTIDQKHRFLPGLRSGELISAYALSEQDACPEQTTAVKKDGYYRITGAKTFITNGYRADLMIVACKNDFGVGLDGISLLLVDKDTPGLTMGRKLVKDGRNGLETADLFFDDAAVPLGSILGEEGKGLSYINQNSQQESLMCALKSLMAAKEMYHLTKGYVKEGKTFNKNISQCPKTRSTFAEIATDIQVGSTLVDDLICKHMDGENIITQVSMAEYWITKMSKRISDRCMQVHDGYGHRSDDKIIRRHRDISVFSTRKGPTDIIKNLFANPNELDA